MKRRTTLRAQLLVGLAMWVYLAVMACAHVPGYDCRTTGCDEGSECKPDPRPAAVKGDKWVCLLKKGDE